MREAFADELKMNKDSVKEKKDSVNDVCEAFYLDCTFAIQSLRYLL